MRGGCPADWVWIVPPESGSLTPVYHQEMLSYQLTPSYDYQPILHKSYIFPEDRAKLNVKKTFKGVAIAVKLAVSCYRKMLNQREKVTYFSMFAWDYIITLRFVNY